MSKFLVTLLFLTLPLRVSAENIALEDVIEEANRSVVNVEVDTVGGGQTMGAGTIISADGYVVTNAHVTEDAAKIAVVTFDDEYYEASLVGADDKTDVALLKVQKPIGFEPVDFADSDSVRVGNSVFAVGNPYGLGNSVSLGIISAKERDIEKGPYDDFLQTDAAINQGNSGGPLFNTAGRMVGMNTAIFSLDGSNSGVGFATPSNIVRWVAEQLQQNGKVVRGWIGISVQKIHSKNPDDKNVLAIAAMAADSPAAKAGLRVGDIITALGEIPLNNPRVFSLNVSKMPPDTEIPVTVRRDGKSFDAVVKTVQMPINADENESVKINGLMSGETDDRLQNLADLGIDKDGAYKAADFPELGLKAYFDEQTREFVVTEVSENTQSALKGIKIGDRFNRINGNRIFGVEDLHVKIKEAADGKISLNMHDNKDIYTVTLQVSADNEQN
jgi:serine protease Do